MWLPFCLWVSTNEHEETNADRPRRAGRGCGVDRTWRDARGTQRCCRPRSWRVVYSRLMRSGHSGWSGVGRHIVLGFKSRRNATRAGPAERMRADWGHQLTLQRREDGCSGCVAKAYDPQCITYIPLAIQRVKRHHVVVQEADRRL
jgi:hypothetical protein